MSRWLVCWRILDVAKTTSNNQTTKQPTNRPTNQPPSNQCQGSPNPRAKPRLVSWWILDVIVASVSAVCRGWPPPPNSGHMSDTSNISNIVHCFLVFRPRAKDQGPRNPCSSGPAGCAEHLNKIQGFWAWHKATTQLMKYMCVGFVLFSRKHWFYTFGDSYTFFIW